MRSLIALMLAAAASLLSGCVYTGFYESDGRSVSSPFSDSPTPHPIYFQYTLKYPDESMFFFPFSDDPRHSDLNLAQIDCDAKKDGSLLINAHVRNEGADVVPANPLLTGYLGAFRVAAVVTTAGGARELIDVVQRAPLTVPDTADLTLGPTTASANDIVAITVVVDPDRVVPDPLRDNNVLFWQGTMQASNPQCTVVR
jgi:hypothetical protein